MNDSTAEAAIRQANTDENLWMVAARVDKLEDLLAETFVLVHITDYRQPKTEWLEHIRSGQMVYHEIIEQSVTVEINGTRALLVARNLVDATIWGSRAVWPLQMTTTFVEDDSVWKPTFSRATTF
ncbi:nuclear transport factor 2 family protein [Paeniglutamicibacter sp. ORCA_105]|uniref:nuclear transport factor 2 family protein n=1 Tax=Paeniglutamicibacter sp. ORCA_105 TaxID=3377336 RepID=UPI0038930F32